MSRFQSCRHCSIKSHWIEFNAMIPWSRHKYFDSTRSQHSLLKSINTLRYVYIIYIIYTIGHMKKKLIMRIGLPLREFTPFFGGIFLYHIRSESYMDVWWYCMLQYGMDSRVKCMLMAVDRRTKRRWAVIKTLVTFHCNGWLMRFLSYIGLLYSLSDWVE